MYNLITIGDPVLDIHIEIDGQNASYRNNSAGEAELCLPYGKKIPIEHGFQDLGGNACNVAVGAHKLGLSSTLLTTIGGDGVGHTILDQLHGKGLSTDLVATDPHGTTRYSIILNHKEERTILSYADTKHYQWPDTVPPTEWIYYSGLNDPELFIQNKLLLYLAKHPSTSLVVNPSSRLLAFGMSALKAVIARSDILILNLEEAEAITGTTLEKEKSVATLIHKLLALGTDEVAITDGPRGAWAGTAEELWHLDSYPVKVVSKTGAGDAFSSGYLTARSLGRDIPHALEWGIANSSGVISQHGAQTGLLDRPGILAMIKKFSKNTSKQL